MQLATAVLGFFLLWAALPAHAVNVIFTDQERSKYSLAMHMDRMGDLYPPGDVPVNTSALLNGDPDRLPVSLSSREFATLKGLYRWEASRDSPQWRALLQHVALDKADDFDRAWATIQHRLRSRVVEELDGMDAAHVVLAVHGFNNTHCESSKWYEAFERAVLAREPEARVVRMYWDGLSYGKGPGIWGEAQYNGPYVGLGLRRILNRLRADLPLRVFTHSSGAFVISNALGDGSGGFKREDLDEAFRVNAAGGLGYGFPKQLSDLRVAMLVPAAPASTFAEYQQGRAGAVPDRLILGTSRKDSATSKFWARCSWGGNTCMAIKPRHACTEVASHLGLSPPKLLVVDFPRPSWPFNYHDHGVASYIADAEWDQLMTGLFDEVPTTSPGTEKWCDGVLPATAN